jgi:DNA polymerase III subunit alpha
VNTANLKEHRDQKVELACVVTEVARQISKRDGSEWGRITVEDFHGTATVLAFGESWAQNKEALVKDAPVLIRGAVSGRERDEEDPPIFLDGVVALDVAPRGRADRALHRAGLRRLRRGAAGEAKQLLVGHPGAPRSSCSGAAARSLKAGGRNGRTSPRLRSRTLRITPRQELVAGCARSSARTAGAADEGVGGSARPVEEPARVASFSFLGPDG